MGCWCGPAQTTRRVKRVTTGDVGRDALQRAVAGLRETHRLCDRGLVGCPWRLMWDEDVAELHQLLGTLGFEVRPRDGGS